MQVTVQHTETKRVTVDLVDILKEAQSSLVGAGNYIKDGNVCYFDNQYLNKSTIIRQATGREIEINATMCKLIRLLED